MPRFSRKHFSNRFYFFPIKIKGMRGKKIIKKIKMTLRIFKISPKKWISAFHFKINVHNLRKILPDFLIQ